MESATTQTKLIPGAMLAGALGIIAAVFAVYFSSIQGEFVYDDLLVILQNPQIKSLSNIPDIFASSYWDFVDAESASHVGYYRPLTMALITVAYVMGDGAPEAFHLLSLVMYCLACIAAWRFAARLLKSEAAGFWAALLFAMHPLHVESIAWISALHDPMYALFGFLALNAYLRWRDSGGAGMPWVSGLWFFLSLLSKDGAVTFIPIVLAIEWSRRTTSETAQPKGVQGYVQALTPLLVVFAGYYLIRVMVFGDALAGFDRNTTHFGVGPVRLGLLRVELIGGAMWLLAWPAELNLFRPFQPELPAGAPSLMIGIAGSLVLVALLAVAWLKRWRPGLALLLLIPAGLVPVLLRVESLGTFPLSDRFLFVSVLGFTGLLAHTLWTRLPHVVGGGILAIIAIAMGARSMAHLPNWANEEVLFRNAVAQNERNPNVHWGLGRIKLGDYAKSGLSNDLIEAHACFDASMDLLAESATPSGADIFATHDDHLQTNLGLGHALLREAEIDDFHDYETVRKVFEGVIEYQPRSERGYIGLGVAWLASGDPNQASTAFRKAITLNPNSPEAHFNMGVLLMRIEEWHEASLEFARCLELRNGNLKDLVFLARALVEAEKIEEAKGYALRALELFPENSDPMLLLGTIAARENDTAAALQWSERALEASPTYGAAHLLRGQMLATFNQKGEAVKALKQACELLSDSFEAHFNLTVLLLDSETPELALPYFYVAYRHRPPSWGIRMRKAAEAIHQDQLPALVMLATIDADRNDLNTAITWIRRAIELAPEDAPSNYIYGFLLRKVEGDMQALPFLKFAADHLPESYQAQMEYAELLLQLNRHMETEPYLKAALKLLSKEPMEPGLREKTAEVIETALKEIHRVQGPEAAPVKDQ
ncbi:MAG: tetratricopeptide (TPR) repeat protein [Planctomycetota bacterium]|jgi:tetratricopeptide (TPR) repeat protein